MSNKWTALKNFDEKKKATKLIVNYFPDCKGKKMISLTSTTCLDLEEMKKQNKINDSTILFNIDNLESNDFIGTKTNKKQLHKQAVKKRYREIMGSDIFYNKNKDNFILGQNIQDIPLSGYVFEKNNECCDLIYADTCGFFNESILTWMEKAPTLQSLKKDGIFALTVLLSRYKLEGDITFPKSNPDIIVIGQSISKKIFLEKMSIIANKIENKTNNILQCSAMIGYGDNCQSPMGVIIFQKNIDF